MDASKYFGEIGYMGAVSRCCPETKFPISNRAIFDIMVYSFQYDDVRSLAIERAEVVCRAFQDLNSEKTFADSVVATTKRPAAVQGRIKSWLQTLDDTLGLASLTDRASTPLRE